MIDADILRPSSIDAPASMNEPCPTEENLGLAKVQIAQE